MTSTPDRISKIVSKDHDSFIDACRLFENGYLMPGKRSMLAALMPQSSRLDGEIISVLYALIQKLGDIAFSFVEWRFLTQSYAEGPSLLERYGYHRLKRPTDLRDPSLKDPDCDLFGQGFRRNDNLGYFEVRRAYMVHSGRGVTVVIRNSSTYFGRDRLPECAYYSSEKFTDRELQQLDQVDFEQGGRFIPIQNLFSFCRSPQSLIYSIEWVLQEMCDERLVIQDWLLDNNGGFQMLGAFLEERLVLGGPCPHLAAIAPEQSQQPMGTVRTSRLPTLEIAEIMKNASAHGTAQPRDLLKALLGDEAYGCRFGLTSGPKGDRPPLVG